MRRRDMMLLTGLALPAISGGARAQGVLDRPIRMVVAYPPGGTNDMLARLVSAELSTAIGQPVVVENRPGSSGIIGAEFVTRAAPDGTTLMMGSVATHAMNAAMFRTLPYDAVTSFTPLSLVAETPNVVIVNPAAPIRTLQELIAAARARPDSLNYGSTSIGGTPHMSGVLLEQRAGIKLNHVPYRGSGPMLADLLGAHLLIAFDNLPASIGGIRAGQIRALAVTTKTRAAVLPDVPTVQESGVPDYEVASWFGVYGPAGMPAPVAQRLERELQAIGAKPEVQRRLAELGTTPLNGDGATLGRRTAAEVAMWTAVARASGIEPQ